MNLFRLGVELKGADVEIDLVIRIRRRAVDPASEPGVLKTLRQPRAEKRGQRLRPLSASERGKRLRFADQDMVAVEVGRRGRLADPKLRPDGVRRRGRRSGKIVQGRRRSARTRRQRESEDARSGKFQSTSGSTPPSPHHCPPWYSGSAGLDPNRT